MKEKLNALLQEGREKILSAKNESELQDIKAAILGKQGDLTALLKEDEDPERLLRRVMSGFELEVLEKTPVEYRCYCSRERMAAALVSLGRKQLAELAEDPKGIELTCQFCDSRQHFAPEEIRRLLEQASRD